MLRSASADGSSSLRATTSRGPSPLRPRTSRTAAARSRAPRSRISRYSGMPGPGRDELADDDVLLEAHEAVGPALDRGLGEHPGGLLERRRRQPRVGGERRLRDSHELGTTLGRTLALLDEPAVRLGVAPGVDLLTGQERGVARLRARSRGAASGGRSPRCACRGSTRPGRGTPSAPRRRGTAASRARP